MTFPNWPDVHDNPQIIMMAVEGNISRETLNTLTAILDSLPTTSKISCVKPLVTLFPSVPLASENVIKQALQRDYQIGCYISDKALVNPSVTMETVLLTVNKSVTSLNSHITNSTKKVSVCRSTVVNGPGYEKYLVALNILGIKADWSYKTNQAMYPFTLSYPGLLCDAESARAANIKPLCPGILSGQWIIPNNALWTEFGENCFTLQDCLLLVRGNVTLLQRLVLDNFYHRMNTRQKHFSLWQARQPFTLNLDSNFSSSKTLPDAIKSILSEIARYKVHFSPNSDESTKYMFNVSQLISWTSSPLNATTLENSVAGYDFFSCQHDISVSENALFYVYAVVVVVYVLAAAASLCLIVMAVARIVSIASPFGFGVVALEDRWLKLLIHWEYVFTVVTSAFSPWILGWSFTFVITLLFRRCRKMSLSRRFLIPGPAGVVTAMILCYTTSQLLKDGGCLENGGEVTFGLFVVLLIFLAPYCILYDLIDYFFEKSAKELEAYLQSVVRKTTEMNSLGDDDQLSQSLVDNMPSDYGSQRKRIAHVFTNTPYSITFAAFAYVCDLTLTISVLAVLVDSKTNSNAVSSLCRNDWLSWRDVLFIFGYHSFLRTLALQTVKYLKNCEGWLTGYEMLKNTVCTSLRRDANSDHEFLRSIRAKFEDQPGLKRCLLLSLTLHFLASPILQSLYLNHITSNWNNYSSIAAQVMYMATFIVTVLYAQVPFVVVAMLKERLIVGINPFFIPVTWAVLLTVIQSTVPYIGSQILIVVR